MEKRLQPGYFRVRLNKPVISLDDLRFEYYKEIGYDHNHMKMLHEKAGIMAIFQYGKIFDAYSIERVLEDHTNCIFDFGGGNIISGYSFDLSRIKKALEPYNNIFFLVPSENKQRNIRVHQQEARNKNHGQRTY
ncbi:MAG: hypothetical protein MZV70_67130 [Desulfobacterales bacterium]|nr:hypothetical protein [Desulfobacterales bacterium]